MIKSIYSDLNSFKNLTLHSGLNILLAERTPNSTNRQSRNGAGKTSLIELIHFIFGSKADADSIFRSQELLDARFGIRFDLGGDVISAERSGSTPPKLFIQGPTENWPIPPKLDKQSGEQIISNKDWTAVLGNLMFDLPINRDEIALNTFSPSFRSLFSYFVRRQNATGFIRPIQQSENQQLWDQQVAISYLLGLDATFPQELQLHREQEKSIAQIKKSLKSGRFNSYFRTGAELRTKSTIIEAQAKKLRGEIEAFQVVPEYTQIEKEATAITRSLSTLSNDDTIDKELIDRMETDLIHEQAPSVDALQKLYSEAGVIFPEIIKKRFDEVKDFHFTIVENRRKHLSAEVNSAKSRINVRLDNKRRLESRLAELMSILRAGGALDQFVRLQEEAGRLEAEAQQLRQQLELVEKLESSKSELSIAREQLIQSIRSDHHERQQILDEAILLFEELSNALYEKAGSLTVDVADNGPSFRVDIDSSRSKGINNMQIFCFDLMLIELASRRGLGPGFLVHDSHLFDGVDERQVAKAIQLGAQKAEKIGFQYIITMNSDVIPKEGFDRQFNVKDFILPVQLTDAIDSGGLFGLHFN